MRKVLRILILALFVLVSPYSTNAANAFDIGLEKDLQEDLEQSRHLSKEAKEKNKKGHTIKDELKRLKDTSSERLKNLPISSNFAEFWL